MWISREARVTSLFPEIRKYMNTRNRFGVKDSINTYLNIKSKRYEQWSDFKTKEDCEKENPDMEFIARKHKEGFTRIYRLVSNLPRKEGK